MCCRNTGMTRKSSLGLVKVRKSSIGWKKSKQPEATNRVERKTVRFAPKEEVAFRHVTQDELQKTWYQQQDFDSFKQDCRKTAQEYAKAQGDVTRLDPRKVCLRGLEQHLTRVSFMNRKTTIASSIKMVLHEQLSQKNMGYSNPERVGEVSRVMSQAALNRAITVAAFDAKLCQL